VVEAAISLSTPQAAQNAETIKVDIQSVEEVFNPIADPSASLQV